MLIGILDDDPAICGMLRELLELTGHQVSVYNNPWDLLMRLFHSDPPILPFDALVVDILLPELVGSQVIQQIQAAFTELPIVVISALPESVLESIRQKFPKLVVLKKPFALADLLQALEPGSTMTQKTSPSVS